jgi:hypothetical protein
MTVDYKQVALAMNREICGGDPHKATALLQAALDADNGETYSANMRAYLLDQCRILSNNLAGIVAELDKWGVSDGEA